MPDYKQLCAELVEKLDELNCHYNVPNQSAMIERADAALTEPDLGVPTDEELLEAVKAGVASFPPRHPEALKLSAVEYEVELEIRKARAVLARWGK